MRAITHTLCVMLILGFLGAVTFLSPQRSWAEDQTLPCESQEFTFPSFPSLSDLQRPWTTWDDELGVIRFDPTSLNGLRMVLTIVGPSSDGVGSIPIYLATRVLITCEGAHIVFADASLSVVTHQLLRRKRHPMINLFLPTFFGGNRQQLSGLINGPNQGYVEMLSEKGARRISVTWVQEADDAGFIRFFAPEILSSDKTQIFPKKPIYKWLQDAKRYIELSEHVGIF